MGLRLCSLVIAIVLDFSSWDVAVFSHQIYAFSEKKNRSMEVNWAILVQIDLSKMYNLVLGQWSKP